MGQRTNTGKDLTARPPRAPTQQVAEQQVAVRQVATPDYIDAAHDHPVGPVGIKRLPEFIGPQCLWAAPEPDGRVTARQVADVGSVGVAHGPARMGHYCVAGE